MITWIIYISFGILVVCIIWASYTNNKMGKAELERKFRLWRSGRIE